MAACTTTIDDNHDNDDNHDENDDDGDEDEQMMSNWTVEQSSSWGWDEQRLQRGTTFRANEFNWVEFFI